METKKTLIPQKLELIKLLKQGKSTLEIIKIMGERYYEAIGARE